MFFSCFLLLWLNSQIWGKPQLGMSLPDSSPSLSAQLTLPIPITAVPTGSLLTFPNSPPSLKSIHSGAGYYGQREMFLVWEIALKTLKRRCLFNWFSESRGLGARNIGVKALYCFFQHPGFLSDCSSQVSSALHLKSEHHTLYQVVWL